MLLTLAAGNPRAVAGEQGASGYGAYPRAPSSSVAEHAKSLFFEGGGRPVSVDRGGYGGAFLPWAAATRVADGSSRAAGQQAARSDSKIIFSGRHEGLAYTFARLIRPIWKLNITRATRVPFALVLGTVADSSTPDPRRTTRVDRARSFRKRFSRAFSATSMPSEPLSSSPLALSSLSFLR